MSSGRMHLLGDIHLITNRCFQERLLLLPNDQINFIIGYWFARALNRYGRGLEIFTFIFLSNHFHILVRDTEGTLATFMCYFQSNVAKNINQILERKGTFWQGHYDDQIVVGENTFWEKYSYVTCNAVKAGLVDKADEWIGWNSHHITFAGGNFQFTLVNRDRYNKACRNRKKKPDIVEFEETYEFSLTAPPGFEEKSIGEIAAHIGPVLRQQEAFHREMRENRAPLGIDAICKQHATDRPKSSAKSPKKRFACKDKTVLLERLAQYKSFIARYRETFYQFKLAAASKQPFHNEWPEGSYPPTGRLPIIM